MTAIAYPLSQRFSAAVRPFGVVAALLALTAALVLVGLVVGVAQTGQLTETWHPVLVELRASRMAVAWLAGSALAVGGVLVQGSFHNPLASPSVLGTTAGASVGGQAALLIFGWTLKASAPSWLVPEMVLPLGCLLGAALSLAVLLVVLRHGFDRVTLLLIGFLLSSLFIAVGSLLTSIAQETWELGRALVAFTLGGVANTGLRHVFVALPLAVAGVMAAYALRRELDVLLTGDAEARALGVDVGRLRRLAVMWTAVLTAGAVSVGGNLTFVGLVVPHGMRRLVGARHALLIPVTALAGGTFVLACDLVVRVVPSATELPLGVVTGFIGAPCFFLLLLRHQRESAHA